MLPRDRLLEQWEIRCERLEAAQDSLLAVVAAKDDTLAQVLWVLEDDRHRHAVALDLCEQRADSLQISLGWSERWREGARTAEEQSSFLRAVTSPPVVFILGALAGGWLTVQVMDAVH